jgi:hypothetical protein
MLAYAPQNREANRNAALGSPLRLPIMLPCPLEILGFNRRDEAALQDLSRGVGKFFRRLIHGCKRLASLISKRDVRNGLVF